MSASPQYLAAIQDFRRMRRRAALQNIFKLPRKDPGLLSYQDVRQRLHAIEKPSTELREIPLNAIKGSVGRYADFTRDFLPKDSIDEQRWARVKTQFTSLTGVPPIEVYQVGEVYFILDGNHRVSVAREMGNETIQAYVKEVKTRVPLKLDEDIDQLLIKTEYTEFLEYTQFDLLVPDVSLEVTAPGRYTIILQQIEAIHFSLEFKQNQEIPYSQAVKHWHNEIYEPIVEIIQTQEILKNYPERTETDLFLWVFKHRARLADTLGWEIPPDRAVKDLSNQPGSVVERLQTQTRQLFSKLFPVSQVDSGPPPGTWRQEKMSAPEGRLFANILVVIDIADEHWNALTTAVQIAHLEGSQIFGLLITPEEIPDTDQKTIRDEFEHRCKTANIPGQIAFEVGIPVQMISDRACWVDLVIIPKLIASSREIQNLAYNCPMPLLIINEDLPALKRILLAYDSSPKSDEALFLAAYISTFWELELSVITILEPDHAFITSETLGQAKAYLEHYGVQAAYIEIEEGKPAESILMDAQQGAADLILMGGYCEHPRKVASCNVLDEVLVNAPQTIMVCR